MKQPTPEQLGALQRFAKRHGRYWKSKLRNTWLDDPVMPDGALLRQLRNQFGPRWLTTFKLEQK